MFTEELPSNLRPLWFQYSVVQASCHNMNCHLVALLYTNYNLKATLVAVQYSSRVAFRVQIKKYDKMVHFVALLDKGISHFLNETSVLKPSRQ